MTELDAFLLARIGEEEGWARAAAAREASWGVNFGGPVVWGEDLPAVEVIAGGKPILRCASEYAGIDVIEHVITWDPARVLAECESRRLIVVNLGVVVLDPFGVEWPEGYKEALEHTLRLLALPYADHPDYRDEWRP